MVSRGLACWSVHGTDLFTPPTRWEIERTPLIGLCGDCYLGENENDHASISMYGTGVGQGWIPKPRCVLSLDRGSALPWLRLLPSRLSAKEVPASGPFAPLTRDGLVSARLLH